MAKKEYNVILILIFLVFCFLMYREYKRKKFACDTPEVLTQEPLFTAEIVNTKNTSTTTETPIVTTNSTGTQTSEPVVIYDNPNEVDTTFIPYINPAIEVTKSEISNLLSNDDSLLFLYSDEKYDYYGNGIGGSQFYKVYKF